MPAAGSVWPMPDLSDAMVRGRLWEVCLDLLLSRTAVTAPISIGSPAVHDTQQTKAHDSDA